MNTNLQSPDWARIGNELNHSGCAVIKNLLSARECKSLAALYDDDKNFRSKVVMARHGFGRGEYKYFSYPLQPRIAELREALYPPLADIANEWMTVLKNDALYPPSQAAFLKLGHAAGQKRPTPLLLRYGE